MPDVTVTLLGGFSATVDGEPVPETAWRLKKARELVKFVKTLKVKVQSHVQGDQVRITGKSKDDLQVVMKAVKDHDFDVPLQFVNFRP